MKANEEEISRHFNECEKYEAQLKAKESDLERQDMIIKCLNIDLDNKEKLLKAKDEEIKELGEIVQQYLIPSKNYDAIIKTKDKEIERLKEKIHRLENDSIVLNMEQRLIDIGLVLDGKLTSKDTK